MTEVQDDAVQALFHIFRQATGDHKMNYVPWTHRGWVDRAKFVEWLRTIGITGPLVELIENAP